MPPKEQTTTAAAPGGYDHLLIAKAPEITKADRQEGYDINLIEQGRASAPPLNRHAVQPPSGSPSSIEKNPITPQSNGYSKSKSTPWYRTPKGLAIIVVVALVVIGVVVGVAVGVTQSKKSNVSGALRPNANEANHTALSTSSNHTALSTALSTSSNEVSQSTVSAPNAGNISPTGSLVPNTGSVSTVPAVSVEPPVPNQK